MFVVPFQEDHEHHQVQPVVEHLRDGGLILYPTETVYGLGGMVDEDVVARLAELKGRSGDQNFLLLIPDGDVDGVHWPKTAGKLSDAFWPGPLTMIVEAEEGAFPPGVRAADGGVALRRSPHPGVRALLEALDAPITSTSANLSGRPPARTPEEALELMRSLPEEADLWFLNGGAVKGGTPSTIVDVRQTPVRLVREGAIPAAKLREVLGELAT